MAGLTCPECGSDLREVGITTRNRWGAGVWSLLWTVLLPLPAVFLWAWFYNSAAPRVHTFQQERLIDCHGQIVAKIRASIEGQEMGWGRETPRDIPAQRMVLKLESPVASELIVDLPSKAYRFTKADGTQGSGPAFDSSALAAWLVSMGIIYPKTQAEARTIDLITAIDEIPTAQAKETHLPASNVWDMTAYPTVVRARSEVPKWVALVAGSFLGLVWVVGIVLIRSRARK